MDNLHDLVYEYNYLFLETVCGLCKLPDPADRENEFDTFAGQVQIHTLIILGQIQGHNVRTLLTETKLEERANLENGKFKHLGLHLHAVLLFLVWLFRLLEWVLRKSDDDLDDFLDWLYNERFGVPVENDEDA